MVTLRSSVNTSWCDKYKEFFIFYVCVYSADKMLTTDQLLFVYMNSIF